MALVTRKALAGWDVHDVYGAFEEYRISGKEILDQPNNPPGYLWSILNAIPDDVPPARLDRARTVQFEEAERAHRARQREEARAAAMAAAGPDSSGRAAARAAAAAAGHRAIGKAAAHRQGSEAARRELARLNREQD
ncbi:hypothetical protein [Nocardia sp. IFM 10818]